MRDRSMIVAAAALLLTELACMALLADPLSAQELVSTTFEFGEGRPFGGIVFLDDTTVQLVTTNTEPWGATSFRDQETGIPAEIVFCFSRPVDGFRIDFSRILAGEILRSFTAGPPTLIEGDIVDQGDQTFTVPAEVGDYGTGSLVWQDLETQFFGFVIDNPPGWATAVDSFAFSVPILENALPTDGSGDSVSSAKPCERLPEKLSVEVW